MAIDVGRELKSICRGGSFPHPPSTEDLNGLLARILKDGAAAEFGLFFDRLSAVRASCESALQNGWLNEIFDPRRNWPYLIDDANCEALLSPGWMAVFDRRHLRWLCRILRRRYGRGEKTFLDKAVADRRIAAEKRALLCRAVFDVEALVVRKPRGFIRLPPLWYYNRSICDRIADIGSCREHAAIRRLWVPRYGVFRVSAALERGIAGDNLAVFELNRQLEDRRIGNALLEHLVRNDAAQCFTYLLSHCPQEVFRRRSPEEWLFTVCRCAGEKLAVAALDEIGRQFPGIAGAARDPWGNTLLWNTLVNEHPAEKLQAGLIRLGCDPDVMNEWGLSYRLLRDADPGKLECAGD